MKKIIIISLLFILLTANISYAETTENSENIVTIKSAVWLPEIESSGENKLLKAKIDFHYEGEIIALNYDYYFSLQCQIQKRKRGNTKYLFYEMNDLSGLNDTEIEGPKDFSNTFTFTFTQQEFEAAKKRGVNCYLNYSSENDRDLAYTKITSGVKTNWRLKPKNNAWTILN